MSTPSWIDPRITVGNLITILGVIAAFVVGWADLRNADQKTSERLADHSLKLERLEAKDAERGREIKAVQARADEKLELMARDMGEVKASLRAISTNIEWIVKQSGGIAPR